MYVSTIKSCVQSVHSWVKKLKESLVQMANALMIWGFSAYLSSKSRGNPKTFQTAVHFSREN